MISKKWFLMICILVLAAPACTVTIQLAADTDTPVPTPLPPTATTAPVPPTSTPPGVPAGWLTYRSETGGFEISYPDSFSALDDTDSLYGWTNGLLLLYNGGQSYDLVVQVWDSQAALEAELGSDPRVTIFPSNGRLFSVMNITQEAEGAGIIATFHTLFP